LKIALDTPQRILTRQINERGANLPSVELAIEPGTGTEGFRIEDGPNGAVRIVGNDERGLIYGVGKFLRDSAWRGASAPKLPVRGIYFATHFHNYYHDAPIEQVQRYIEDLALWGVNSLTVWFDMHHFNGVKDPAAQAMLDRLRAFLKTAKSVGMDRGLVLIANEGYANSPVEMRATGPGRGGFYNREICPNAPGGQQLILKQFEEEFAEFASVGINHVWIWPYDQGSCSCEKCRPWGSNGFLKSARPLSDLARTSFPECKVCLSTWYMDEEEWEGLAAQLCVGANSLPTHSCAHWVDYLISQEDTYAFKKGSPGGLPILGFPEISMNGMYPWGGFGANPQPQAFQEYWDSFRFGISAPLKSPVNDSFGISAPLKSRNNGHNGCAGGWPYSEGVFEDINKVIFAQLYWDPDRSVWDIIREYAASQFSPDVADDVVSVIRTLEQNHHMRWWPGLFEGLDGWLPSKGAEPQDDPGAEEAHEIAKRVDARLTEGARESWRWRIIYLRALLDAELKLNGGKPNEACEQAFRELTRIYFAENAEGPVKPPAFTASR
jgi:hypothetical protein